MDSSADHFILVLQDFTLVEAIECCQAFEKRISLN